MRAAPDAADLLHELRRHVPADVPADLPEHLPEHVRQNVPEHVSEHLSRNMREHVPQHVSGNVRADVSGNVRADVPRYVRANVSSDLRADLPADVLEDVPEHRVRAEHLPNRLRDELQHVLLVPRHLSGKYLRLLQHVRRSVDLFGRHLRRETLRSDVGMLAAAGEWDLLRPS